LKKEIEEDYRRWKDCSFSWIGRINIVKRAVLPKAIYMFNAISIKITVTFITEIEKPSLKFIWKHKRPWIAKVILNKKSNTGDITTLQIDFKLYYRAIANKNSMVRHKNGYEDQWNRVVDLDRNSCSYAHYFLAKASACRKLKLDTRLSPVNSDSIV
jgi:hypothetical protein